ncbi:bifunctional adenosylcobinamide kinase/adenosylcobinamide-phosphate guanylyltransferase [Paraburkholderia silviterrae]|uniref:Bifunctional adenosylcobalamin biosynthesis protein n=1 Tax=Paraburkholderia silviterrae TaxID=2528715 RepID=A0A4R5M5P5_9BURK|nr:bifunctional adenosylcobinamide kinase/adenosylcobinamide-phosphate guanylyltransferase [Paraburkholderia silviterrae]TDG20786.1 bifunctional adenosylcobinamide kinase/adenosylcobinamide-phosphate guanylyltransferase [Paraburkholderia silviterrae]
MISRDFTFIVGGARSGKSAYAERLAAESGLPVTYIATAATPGGAHADAEFAARIAHHRARRPAHWAIVEAPLDLAGALDAAATPGQCVLIDCLTLWLANLLCPPGSEAPLSDWRARLDAFAAACERAKHADCTVLVVSNEIGMGVVPMGAATRLYVDELGRLNQRIAALAHRATLVAAGLPLVLKAPSPDAAGGLSGLSGLSGSGGSGGSC